MRWGVALLLFFPLRFANRRLLRSCGTGNIQYSQQQCRAQGFKPGQGGVNLCLGLRYALGREDFVPVDLA